MVACHFPYVGCGEDQTANGRVSLPEEWNAGTKFVLTPLRLFHKMEKRRDFSSSLFLPLGFCGDFLAVGVGRVGEFHRGVYLNLFLGRTREYALRRSLGASDGRNACWMLTEATPVVVMGILVAAMGMEWLRYDGLLAGSPVYVYKGFRHRVGVGTGVLFGRHGLSGAQDASGLSSFLCGAVSFRSFPCLVVGRAVFCLRVPAFPVFGDATSVVRDDKFRFGFRPSKHPQALHRVEGHAGDGCDLQLPGHL